MKEINFESREQLTEYVEAQREEMYEMIVNGIDQAYAMGADVADIVTFYIEDEDVYIDMVSERNDWKKSLTLALDYYVSVEMYEKCVKLKALIERL